MISLKIFLYGILYGAMPLILVSCSKTNNQLSFFKTDCPADYKLSDISRIENYYNELVNNSSQYLAFKEFSKSGYKLVSLVSNGDQYFLSVSLAAIPEGTVSTIIDSNIGNELFKQAEKIESLDHLDLGEAFHTNCVIVGINTLNTDTVSTLYNPPLLIHQYIQDNNSGLRLYSTLKSLADKHLPNHTKTIVSLHTDEMTPVNIGDQVFYPDTYVNATEEESKMFRYEIMHNPFFELDKFIHRQGL